MIRRLQITNYALIQQAELEFESGLTVMTGESGAGKSIVLEALGLVLGSRASFNTIRNGEDKCSVEAVFEPISADVVQILKDNSLDVFGDLILRRELTASGRSRAFINDTPVNLSILKEVGRSLVDLHGQQENLALQSAGFQMAQLDAFAKSTDIFQRYQTAYRSLKQCERELHELREAAAQIRKDQDYFQYQYDELTAANLDDEELVDLEDELNKLEHAGEITAALQRMNQLFEDDDRGLQSSLKSILQEIKGISGYGEELSDLMQRVQSVSIEVDDMVRELDRLARNIEMDPERLELVREKSDELNRLFHKHGVQEFAELKKVRDEYKLKLESIDSFDEELEKSERSCLEAREKASKIASELFGVRQKHMPAFEEQVTENVRVLGMPKATFRVRLEEIDQLSEYGSERISMRFDANGEKNLQPLDQAASGGELARLMLALKSVASEGGQNTTLIFDEIDTGVSGEVAKRIGILMKTLGERSQVLAVTHLPGVAASGKHHIKVFKQELGDQVVSNLKYLGDEERIRELAGMFSGETVNEASLESARSLLTSR